MFSLPDRFWEKALIEDTGHETPCLTWTAYRLPNGYGRFGFDGKVVYAHRLAYEALIGSIPQSPPGEKRLVIDHLCRNRACVNVTHMEVVTDAVNMARGIHHQRVKTHCPKGHPYDEENTRWREDPTGRRACRACMDDRNERRRNERANR